MKSRFTFQFVCFVVGVVLLCGLVLANVDRVRATGVCYVKAEAAGSNNGSSWVNAFTSLQSALGASPCTEVWVAAGTYKPTSGANRTISFALKNGVAIFGGFAGTETLLSERDPVANQTILSGEIGDMGITTDNSFHVVIGSGTNSTAILDGFVITASYSTTDDTEPWFFGGGMYNYNGHPSLSNITFDGNTAAYGGGIFNHFSSPTLLNVTFTGNASNDSGGGMYNVESSPLLIDVIFSNNSSIYWGAGMQNYNHSSPVLRDVTFSGNSSGQGAGGMYNGTASNAQLRNVTFSGNQAQNSGGAMYNEESSPTLTNVTVHGNSGSDTGGIYNISSNPVLTNVTFSGNSGTALHNYLSSPTVTNSIFYGDGAPEIYNNNFSVPLPSVTYSIVQGGYTGTGNLSADPLLGSLTDNGGRTHTMALSAGSPAIDAGTDTGCPTTDQRGAPRPLAAHCDIGSYEYGSAPNVPPAVLSITRADTDPSSSRTVGFFVTFTEPVTGLEVDSPYSDLALATTGVTGSFVSAVSGFGDTYLVSVNTGSGNGTIRLDVVDDDGIHDKDGNPLGGPNAGNGNYSSGQIYTMEKSKTFISTASQDGWVLESTETSGQGGAMASAGPSFLLGDDAVNRQYRAVLSFKTSGLPDDAVIQSVTLRIKKAGLVGRNPFSTHGNILVDVRKGAFSGSTALQLQDFQASASKNGAMTITNNPDSGWYSKALGATNFKYINKTGTTQFRLRFKSDDDNDWTADYFLFFSGNAQTAAYRPQLIVAYYTP